MKRVIPLLIIALLAIPVSVVFANSRSHENSAKPSVVLVHGAWADGSSWNRVISRMQDEGFVVFAVANPLRGLASDSAYLASFLKTITGPIILVGHSYGGAVITNAATGMPKLKASWSLMQLPPAEEES